MTWMPATFLPKNFQSKQHIQQTPNKTQLQSSWSKNNKARLITKDSQEHQFHDPFEPIFATLSHKLQVIKIQSLGPSGINKAEKQQMTSFSFFLNKNWSSQVLNYTISKYTQPLINRKKSKSSVNMKHKGKENKQRNNKTSEARSSSAWVFE